jgi:hypothetical protein|tara:strand:- start:2297 stop:2575 length:279 start_codon:yes stop_codon:yes gene_type:complete
MEQITIDPPKDQVSGYYITNPVPVEFEFVGRVIRMRYTFRTGDEPPLEVIGKRMQTASENMLTELVRQYKHYISLPRLMKQITVAWVILYQN